MKVKIIAPEGYKYHDTVTGKDFSELCIDDKQFKRFTLVPDTKEKPIEI